MAKVNTVPTTPVGRVTATEVRLEVTEETAQLLRQAADLAGPRPRLIVTCRGEALGEIVALHDAGQTSEAAGSERLARPGAPRQPGYPSDDQRGPGAGEGGGGGLGGPSLAKRA